MRYIDVLKINKKIYEFSNNFALIVALGVYGFISIISMISTTYFIENRVESVGYKIDNIFINMGILILVIMMISICLQKIDIDKLDMGKLELGMLIMVLIIGVLWVSFVQSKPFADGKVVSDAVRSFNRHDFSLLGKKEYFGKFPFQLCLLELFKVFYWLGGEDNYMFLQVLNVISLTITYHLIYLTSRLLFEEKKVHFILVGLMVTCFPAILYCSFIYGTMYGFVFSTGAIYQVIKFYYKRSGKSLLLAVPLMSLSILIKNNFLIVFLALVILVLLEWIKEEKKTIIPILFIITVLLLNTICSGAIQKKYEEEAKQRIHSGIPSISWIAMGLQEGNKGPGWYNSTMFELYDSVDGNTEKMKQKSKKLINSTMKSYSEQPVKFIAFIGKKIISQWNEPTYESLWVSEHIHEESMHSISLSKVARSVYYGKINGLYKEYCNIYHLLIFASSFVCFWKKRKEMNLLQCIFMIVILGGFFFHIIWEANSKYIITYFVYSLPYAAVGICLIEKKIHQILCIKPKVNI